MHDNVSSGLNSRFFFPSHTNTVGSKEEILLVMVPNFDITHSCVLVNLSTLDCFELKISGEASEDVDQGLTVEEEEEGEPMEEGEKTFNILEEASDDDM